MQRFFSLITKSLLVLVNILFTTFVFANGGQNVENGFLKKDREIIQKNYMLFSEEVRAEIKNGDFSLDKVLCDFLKKEGRAYEITVGINGDFDHPVVFPVAVLNDSVLIFKDEYKNLELLNKFIDVSKLKNDLNDWIKLGIFFSPYGFMCSPFFIKLKFSDSGCIKSIRYLPGILEISSNGKQTFVFEQIYSSTRWDFFKVTIKGSLKENKISFLSVENVKIDMKTGKPVDVKTDKKTLEITE